MAKVPMSALQSNSHKAKSTNVIETPKGTGVKRVAQGRIRKHTLGDKFRDAFIAEDAKSVKEYVVMDVIIPGLKDLLLNIFHNSIDMVFTGRRANVGHSGGYYSNHRNYGGFYNSQIRNATSDRMRRNTYEDVGFDSSKDAADVLEQMRIYLDEYKRVSIATFNELAGVTGDYTDNRYGWKSLSEANISYHNGQYYINFPRPRDLNI